MGTRLAGVLPILVLGCRESDADRQRCHDVCGVGTTCIDGRCVADAPVAEVVSPGPKASPRKRGRRSGPTRVGSTSTTELPPFVPVDDSHIPRHDPEATQNLDDTPGSERLSDAVAREELAALEPAFNACIARAAEYSPDEIAAGSVSFALGIRPTGKVSGVTAQASRSLQVFGIVPCLRKVIFDHRFPSWDGPPLTVEYRFAVQ